MLERYRILDLSDDRGHLAGMVLAQLGAEVIAVEPPGGQRARRLGPFADRAPDPERSLTHWAYNRGKKSIVVDDVAQVRRLAAGADAIITSDAADDASPLDVDLAELRAEFPHLVTASISAFGDDGPKANWAATDLICTAAAGPMGITGDRDRAPVRLSLPQTWHYAAGDALCGVLLALREREQSGLGQHVDISAQQSYIIATQYQMLYPFVDQASTRRMSGGGEIGPLKLRLVYEAADGHVSLVFLVGPTVGPYNTRLFSWMDEEGMCPEEFRDVDWVGFGAQLVSNPDIPEVLNRGGDVINAFTKTKTKAELLQGALDRNLLLAPITTTSELLGLEQLAERNYWRDIDGVVYPGGVASMSATPLVTDVGPPRLGADNDSVLGAADDRQWARPAGAASVATASVAPASVRVTRTAPLEGVNVLDLTWAIAGPFSSRILGDFGADVIRIESEKKPCIMRGAGPHMNGEAGAENSLGYATINSSKRSLAIDLTDQRSLPVMEELVAWADVLIESFSVGVIDRIGLGYEHLATINPGLVMVSTSLMGQTGPIRGISGFGNIGAAVAGFYPFGGWPDRPPCGPFGAYSDYISPRFTVAAVLAALDHRDRTGIGQHIDYSQMEGAVHLLAPALLDDAVNGVVGTRIGNRDANMAPHGAYPLAGEDRWLAIACETSDHWRTLANVIGRSDLAQLSLEERFERHDELDDAISQWSRSIAGVEAEAKLQSLAVPAHRVLYAPDVAEDPQLRHRGAFRQADHELWGQLWVEDAAIHLSATPGTARWAAPTFGQHLYPILTEVLGRSPDEAADLIGTGIFQ